MTNTDFGSGPSALTATQHEHGWQVESQHATSEGLVIYVRCDCGTRRVDVLPPGHLVPMAISVEVRPGRSNIPASDSDRRIACS